VAGGGPSSYGRWGGALTTEMEQPPDEDENLFLWTKEATDGASNRYKEKSRRGKEAMAPVDVCVFAPRPPLTNPPTPPPNGFHSLQLRLHGELLERKFKAAVGLGSDVVCRHACVCACATGRPLGNLSIISLTVHIMITHQLHSPHPLTTHHHLCTVGLQGYVLLLWTGLPPFSVRTHRAGLNIDQAILLTVTTVFTTILAPVVSGTLTWNAHDYAKANLFFWNDKEGPETPPARQYDFGDNDSPVTTFQTVTLRVGNKYRLQWWTGREGRWARDGDDGVSAFQISGYSRVYYKVRGKTRGRVGLMLLSLFESWGGAAKSNVCPLINRVWPLPFFLSTGPA
jgi:hypothetical protein